MSSVRKGTTKRCCYGKKVKKEEAFSRLNLAKINQNWHQILRKAKCQEMNENVEQLKNWIDRILAYKNRTISKLLKDLEDAEEDYTTTFNSHSKHICSILEKQFEYIEKLNSQYLHDQYTLLTTAEQDKNKIHILAEEELTYLKTVLYRQEVQNGVTKKEVENYKQKYYEAQHEFQMRLESMQKSREQVCSAIWKQIDEIVAQYNEKTDERRLHLAELKRLDAESAAEIIQNEERIKLEKAQIQELKEEFEKLRSMQENNFSFRDREMDVLKHNFFKIRKNLSIDLLHDDKKLKFLVKVSTETIEYLQKLLQKGQHILFLADTCKKFETEKETVMFWFPNSRVISKPEEDDLQEDGEGWSQESQVIQFISTDPFKQDGETEDEVTIKSKQSAAALSPQSTNFETPSPEVNNITTVQNVILHGKPIEETLTLSMSPSSSSSEEKSTSIIDKCLKDLKPMENFWSTYNKVELDCIELKQEKKSLEQENKELRGMIRAILESEALANSIPNSKVSTRVPSRKMSMCSAPLRRIIFG